MSFFWDTDVMRLSWADGSSLSSASQTVRHLVHKRSAITFWHELAAFTTRFSYLIRILILGAYVAECNYDEDLVVKCFT